MRLPIAWVAWLGRHLGVAALLAGFLLGLAAWSLPHLRFDSDINRVFMSDDPLSQAQRAFEAASDPVSAIAILIEADQGLSAAQLEAVRIAALDLEFAPGVQAVLSPFVLRFPPDHPSFPREPVFPLDLKAQDVTDRLAEFRGLGLNLPTYITPDQRRMLLGVSVRPGTAQLADAVDAIEATVAPLRAEGLRAHLTGEDVVTLVTQAGLKADLLRLNLIGSVLVALVAGLFLRDWRLAVIAIGPGLATGLVTLSLAVALDYPITLLNNVIPLLVFILGVANGVHVTHHLRSATGTFMARLSETIATVGPATILTAATTAIAFSAIGLTDNAQLYEFAVLGAVGTALGVPTFFATVVILALYLRPAESAPNPWLLPICDRLTNFSTLRARSVALVGVLATGLASWGFSATTPWFPAFESIPSDSGLVAVNDRVAQSFGGVFQAWVELPPGSDWAKLQAVTEAVEKAMPAETVLAEPLLARWQGSPDLPPDSDALSILPDVLAQKLRDPTNDILRIAVAVPEPMRDRAALDSYDSLETAALDAGAARVIGLPAVMRHASIDLIRQLAMGLIIACLVATALIALVYRRGSFLVIILATNLLPVLAVGASLHVLTGGQLNPTAVLALTIAFGIAVDDTTHFLNHHALALRGGLSGSDAIRVAMRRAGGAVIVTTLILIAGLLATMLSDFFPVRLFGGMLMLSLVAALLADLLLLPALLSLWRKDNA